MPSATSTPVRRHGCDGDPRAEPGGQVAVREHERRRVRDPEPHPADVALVRHARRRRLQRDREADLLGRRHGRLRVLDHTRGHDRDPGVGQHRQRLVFVERAILGQARDPTRTHALRQGRAGRGGRRAGAERGVVQQVLERAQPRQRSLQHGDAAVAEDRGLVLRHGARQVRQHAERDVGRGPDVGRDPQVALVEGLALAREVDHERHRGDGGVVGERREGLGEDPVGVDPGAPRVERVPRLQAGIQDDRRPARSWLPRPWRTARPRRPRGRRAAPARRRSRARSRCRRRSSSRAAAKRTAPSCRPSRPGCAPHGRRTRRTPPRRRRARPRAPPNAP